MRLLFIGSKDRGVECLRALNGADVEIVGVVTDETDDPDKFWTGSVAEEADRHGLPTLLPEDVNAPSAVSWIEDRAPDLIAMSGYNQILDESVLNVPPDGVVNLHAGKLPEYRGGSPMNWAIINGETSGVATIHYATERVDAGDVLAEEPFEIAGSDTIDDVRQKTLEIFPDLLVEVVSAIDSGTATARENDPAEGTYWGSRSPEDGEIRWETMTAKNVYDFVRALTHPYPGAFTTYRGERLYVWEASLMDQDVRHAPGRVCMRRGEGRVVAARDRGLVLETVQPEGCEEQPAADYLERGSYLG